VLQVVENASRHESGCPDS